MWSKTCKVILLDLSGGHFTFVQTKSELKSSIHLGKTSIDLEEWEKVRSVGLVENWIFYA